MSELGDTFRAMRDDSKARRARNRAYGAAGLLAAGVRFSTRNQGDHLMIEEPGRRRIDYWPGTGLWKEASGRHSGRGINSLLKYLKT